MRFSCVVVSPPRGHGRCVAHGAQEMLLQEQLAPIREGMTRPARRTVQPQYGPAPRRLHAALCAAWAAVTQAHRLDKATVPLIAQTMATEKAARIM